MDISIIIICLSVVLQLTAAVVATRLLLLPGRRLAGLITLTIILLMAFRRFLSLYRFVNGEAPQIDFFAESIAFSISFLLLIGILYLSRLILSERKIASMLKYSKQHYQALFNQSPDGVLLIDLNGNILEFNETAARDLGFTREEFSKLHLSDIDPVETKEEIKKRIGDVLREGKAEFEVQHRTKGGDVRDVHVITLVVDLAGNKGFHTIWRDITEKKAAEERLRKNERQLIESQRVARLGNWDLDLVSQKLEWSDQTYRLFDKDPKEFAPSFNEFVRLVHPDDLETMQTNFNNALKSDDKPYHVAVRIINDSGSQWVMEAFGIVRRDPSGKAISIFGTAQDITERKKAEEKIHKSEEFIRNILNTVDEGFIVIDSDYRILTANTAYCSQVGCYNNKIIGQHCYEISHKTSRPCYEEGEECAPRQVFETGKTHSALHRHKDSHGNILYVETKAFPIKDASGAVTSVIETINNITEKHLLEEERLKTQKLESIGTLAGGIAHDFNNLLQGVFGYISLAKMTVNNKEKSTAAMEQAEKALHQSVNLTTQLLTFAKGGKPAKKLIHLGPIIANSAKFTLSGSRSDLHLDIPDDLWRSEADGGQLCQVIQNIVLNADQAMPVGGSIRVTAANVKKSEASLPPGLAKGDYVKIAIQDNGVGIPQQYMSMIFDPYFTTKEKGSGLGLATSYSIVKNHGGMIELRTKSGEGSTFMIYLPAIAGEIRTEAAEKPQNVCRSHKSRILVMDDEELIRNLSSEMLEALDHVVEVAKHGQEALEHYQTAMASGKPFDIVILDLTIRGGMGGSETIQKLIEIDPSVKAIVSSGYSDDAVTANYEKQGFKAFLKKPYDVNALREMLNKMLSHNSTF